MTHLYRRISNRREWQQLVSERINDGWFRDVDLTQPATAEEADSRGEDIYTDGGWNQEPTSYPALVELA